MVGIFPRRKRGLGKYSPLTTSTSVNNCYLAVFIVFIMVLVHQPGSVIGRRKHDLLLDVRNIHYKIINTYTQGVVILNMF